MDTPETPSSEPQILSLDDHILKYDYADMRAQAQSEFDASLSSRELIDQDSIAKIFKLDKNDERN